jgi:hypothetical protein
VKEFLLKMKNNEASGCDGIPAEFRNIFCIRRDGIETLKNISNKTKNEKEFPLDCKTAITYPVYKGKANREKPETTEEFRFYRYVAEYFGNPGW